MEWKRDKVYHFLAGMVLSLCGCIWIPLVILGFLAGVVKEQLDMYTNGDCDIHDAKATWLGAAVGGIISLIVWALRT